MVVKDQTCMCQLQRDFQSDKRFSHHKKIGRNHGITNTSELVVVTVNCSLVSMHKIPEQPERHKNCSKHLWKIMNDQTIVKQLLLLQSTNVSKQLFHYSVASIHHPCADQWQVAVAAHSLNRGEIERGLTNKRPDNRTWIIREPSHPPAYSLLFLL